MIRKVEYSKGILKLYLNYKKEPYFLVLQEGQSLRNVIEVLMRLATDLMKELADGAARIG